MTANTPNRAYTYPQSTDNAQIWSHFQELATDIDTDMAAGLATTNTNDPGTVQANFVVNAAYAVTAMRGKSVHLWLELSNNNTLTATSGNLTDVSCYITDAAYRPDTNVYLPCAFNTGAGFGTAQLGPDGNILLQTAFASLSPGAAIRMYWTFLKA